MDRFAPVAAVAFATASAAIAQPVGQFGRSTQIVAHNLVAAEMGRCLLKRDRSRAIGIVEAAAGSDIAAKLSRDIRQPMIACLKGSSSATVSVFYLRGSIAEALLRENGAALLTRRQEAQPVPATRISAEEDVDPVVAIVACAVAAQPAAAAALIAADPQTPAEMAAFQRLAPSLQACAPATGEVKLRRPAVRPGVAIALYGLGLGDVAAGAAR